MVLVHDSLRPHDRDTSRFFSLRFPGWCSGTTTPWEDDVCAKYADTAATTIEGTGTKIATLFVQTTNECPSNKQGPGGCYPGSTFLQNQIASDPGLAQRANWNDLNALVVTMADQIVAGIC